jgi:hypothetical protein
MKDRALDKCMAYLLIRNSDQSKYSLLVNELVSQFSMDNSPYPKNIMNAADILSNHKHDQSGNQGNQGNQWSKRNWYNSKKEEDDDETSSTLTSSETSFVQSSKA